MNMFGVENVSDVPDYKFVRINKTKLDDGRLKLNFFAWGSEYILMLSPNLHLVSPDLVSSSFSSFFYTLAHIQIEIKICITK